LEVDAAAAEVMQRIFAEYVAGNGDPGDRRHAQRRGCAVPIFATAGSEPTPSGGRLAGQHRAGDPRQPAVHGLRGVRALGSARAAVGPGGRCGRARDSVPAVGTGTDRALSHAGASGDRVRRAVHAGAAASADEECRGPGDGAEGEVVRKTAYYRCAIRTMAPGAAAFASHPTTVNLREDVIQRDQRVDRAAVPPGAARPHCRSLARRAAFDGPGRHGRGEGTAC
jgi:hypothetical protein